MCLKIDKFSFHFEVVRKFTRKSIEIKSSGSLGHSQIIIFLPRLAAD